MKLKGPITGSVLVILLCLNTVFWCTWLYLFALLKLIPIKPTRRFFSRCITRCAHFWSWINNNVANCVLGTQWHISGTENLSNSQWYLVVSNHQSWLDIVVLNQAFLGKIPFLKFFLKDQLKWVPILGLAWMGLDYPFMKRYSKAFLQKHPERKGRDLAATKRSCLKFRHTPTTIMNFAEGTRFSLAKKQQQNSPYQHLLRPRAGGIAYVLSTMGEQLNKILDVTIVYPKNMHSLWGYLTGKITSVSVHIRSIDITPELLGDYFSDPEYQTSFKEWINKLWNDKDQLITSLRTQYPQGINNDDSVHH